MYFLSGIFILCASEPRDGLAGRAHTRLDQRVHPQPTEVCTVIAGTVYSVHISPHII